MRTNEHPNALGNGSLQAIFSKRLDITTLGTDATSLDCLYISFNPEIQPGMAPSVTPHAATIAVSPTGAGASKARITLAVKTHTAAGADAGDVSFTIDCDGTSNGAWSSGNVTVYDLKGVIDAINEDDAGGTSGALLGCFKAWIGPGGMYDLVVTQANMFLTDAAEYITNAGTTGSVTGVLRRDMAVHTLDSDFLVYWRINGDAEVRDRNLFKLLDLYGTVGTDTGATLYVVRDDVEDYVKAVGTWATDLANHEEVYSVTTASLPAYAGFVGAYQLNHNPVEAPVVRGPLVVILKGDTGDTQTLNLIASFQQAVL